jgi:hypothetical protein
LPAEQEKAVTAKRAPAGLNKPLESHFHEISGARASEINGSAMRAARGEEPEGKTNHEPTSTFTAPFAAATTRFRPGVE